MSLNDPQWGKRGRSGPPDLDEIWRNVNRRLNELLGRRDADAHAAVAELLMLRPDFTIALVADERSGRATGRGRAS